MGEPITKPKTFSICTESRIDHENDKGMVMTAAHAREQAKNAQGERALRRGRRNKVMMGLKCLTIPVALGSDWHCTLKVMINMVSNRCKLPFLREFN